MNETILRELQIKHLNFLVHDNSFDFSTTFHPYTSGEIGPYFASSQNVLCNPSHAKQAFQDLGNLVAERMKNTPYDLVSGGETRDWIFSIPIATQILGKPTVMLYNDGKVYGGTDLFRKRVVHIADLNNEGSSPREKWVPIIRNAGGIIEDIFFYVDRLEQGVVEMKKLGLNSYALVPLDENAWQHLKSIGKVDEQTYRNLMERGKTKEERDAWAVKMLRSPEGLERLAKILANPKTRNKGERILTKGYPELSQELTERLRQFEGLRFFGLPSEDTR